MSEHSEKLDLLAADLSIVQASLKGAEKDAENPFFHSHYATLNSVWDACRSLLGANGLSLVQTFGLETGRRVLITTLLHESGQWIRGSLLIPSVKEDPHSVGAAITYARRFSLSAMLGIVEADDDGNSAMNQEELVQKAKPGGENRPNNKPTQKPQAKENQLATPVPHEHAKQVAMNPAMVQAVMAMRKAALIEVIEKKNPHGWSKDNVNALIVLHFKNSLSGMSAKDFEQLMDMIGNDRPSVYLKDLKGDVK